MQHEEQLAQEQRFPVTDEFFLSPIPLAVRHIIFPVSARGRPETGGEQGVPQLEQKGKTMKTRLSFSRLLGAVPLICSLLFPALAARAQWIPAGPPAVVSQEFITTGGITYFRLVGWVSQYPLFHCCKRITGYEVSRQETNIFQTIQCETWTGLCLLNLCDPWREEWVSVLGPLPPGNYNLTLAASNYGNPQPWAWCPFTVPTNSSQTLTVAPGTNSSLLSIAVEGISTAVYVLQASTNLTDWTAVETHVGAPVTFSVGLTNGPQRFYRAVVLPGSRRLY